MRKHMEEIVERINEIISEEMGINFSVENSANEITSSIEKAITLNGSHEGSFKSLIEEHKFNVYWKCLECATKEDAINYSRANSSFLDRLSFLNVTVGVFNGKILKHALKDSIFHELSHIFQQNKAGKLYPGQKLYLFSYQNRRKNEVYLNIWRALYASNTTEQDAMINGMYGYVESRAMEDIEKGVFRGTIDQYIMDSAAIEWLNYLYEAEEYLNQSRGTQEFKEAFREYFSTFHLSPKKLFHIIRHGKRRFEEKIAKAEWLCKSRQAEKYPLSEQFSPVDDDVREAKFRYTINFENCTFGKTNKGIGDGGCPSE